MANALDVTDLRSALDGQSTTCRFFELPRELRDHVYDALLGSDRDIPGRIEHPQQVRVRNLCQTDHLLVCRQFRTEMAERESLRPGILIAEGCVNYHYDDSFLPAPRSIPGISHVEMHLPVGCDDWEPMGPDGEPLSVNALHIVAGLILWPWGDLEAARQFLRLPTPAGVRRSVSIHLYLRPALIIAGFENAELRNVRSLLEAPRAYISVQAMCGNLLDVDDPQYWERYSNESERVTREYVQRFLNRLGSAGRSVESIDVYECHDVAFLQGVEKLETDHHGPFFPRGTIRVMEWRRETKTLKRI